ncbi:hypothetical protein [Kitasatospora fiedleri]|uniref:hypothetical protein n=1 Tax=Kitasatospora fiedleri TaxID=2991545 RepID=UPI00249CAF75|nr:hypothetical protein [Kitasatospora fiedleri]
MTEASRRAWEAASRLAALTDAEVQVSEVAEGIRIRLPVNSDDSDLDHLEVLAVLGASDRYGHRRFADGSGHLWAVYRQHRP